MSCITDNGFIEPFSLIMTLLPERITRIEPERMLSRIELPSRVALMAAAALALAAGMPYSAKAALGQPEASVTADAQTLRGSIKSTDTGNYRVHLIDLPSGTVLREYATLGGIVFAVAWSGPTIPNLQQSLGNYYASFVKGAQASRTGHHQLQIRQDDFVMQSSGHMRAFIGRAYLPQAIPAGVSLQELY
jgi:hypothetical protein